MVLGIFVTHAVPPDSEAPLLGSPTHMHIGTRTMNDV